MSLEINRADALAEVTVASGRYEAALRAGRREDLDMWFWADERASRFAPDGAQYGHAAIVAMRQRAAPSKVEQRIVRQTVTTFGEGFAVTTLEFVRDEVAGVGRRTQAWIKIGREWRIASAHLSFQTSASLPGQELELGHADVR